MVSISLIKPNAAFEGQQAFEVLRKTFRCLKR